MLKNPYQPLIKLIRKLSNFDSFQSLLDISTKDWVFIHLRTDNFFFNSYTVNRIGFELYKNSLVCDLDFSLMSYSACYFISNSGYSLDKNYRQGIGESKLQPLFFYRYFDGYPQYNNYELLQDFVHVSNIFWISNKNAYCSLNGAGDIEEKIIIINEEKLKLILVEKYILDLFLNYSGQFLIRFFEARDNLNLNAQLDTGINFQPQVISANEGHRWIKEISEYFIRGAELVLPQKTVEEIESREKPYEKFIIHDWKNNRIIEWSCNPLDLDNYFQDTDKPYETSPVFFNSEVLSLYKHNPDKYELTSRRVSCRGTWTLESFDVNDEGQIHTYICYLGNLPYQEQLHWKRYNEYPKGNISQRAYNTDFLGQYDEQYCPLTNIGRKLSNFPMYTYNKKSFPLWVPKEALSELLNKIHYVITDNKKEYRDFVLYLSILINDGFQQTHIQELITTQITSDKNVTEIKSLEGLKYLLTKWQSSYINEIIKPLQKLQRLRSKFAGHGGGLIDFDIKSESVELATEIDKAITLFISEIVKNSS